MRSSHTGMPVVRKEPGNVSPLPLIFQRTGEIGERPRWRLKRPPRVGPSTRSSPIKWGSRFDPLSSPTDRPAAGGCRKAPVAGGGAGAGDSGGSVGCPLIIGLTVSFGIRSTKPSDNRPGK